MMKPFVKHSLALAMFFCMAVVYAGSDPADGENTADHPEVSRFPGFHIDNSKMNDFSEFHFASEGLDDSGEPKGEVKSGKYWFVDYI